MLFNVIEYIHKFINIELFISSVAATVHLINCGLYKGFDAIRHKFGDGTMEDGGHRVDHGTVQPIN
jgi:hypothetical protein